MKTCFRISVVMVLLLIVHGVALGCDSSQHKGQCSHKASQVMPNAQAVFSEVEQLIQNDYVEPEVTEDDLWTGAIDGMLDRLIQHSDKKINTLLSPEELKKLSEGLKGEFAGIGVVIKQVEGVAFVVKAIEGGPAVGADIKAGDRILSVDGLSITGLPLEAVVGKIRGPVDSKITLLVQRDTDEREISLTRAPVRVDPVVGTLLEGDVGYIRIISFADETIKTLDDTYTALVAKGAKRLVLDLRDCPGGAFESSVAVTERFLPKGTTITYLKDRKGEEKYYKSGKGTKYELPMVVLVNGGTASGGELVAAALADNGRARLVGERTFGKGTVESVHELSNGWGVKLTTALFYSPDGENWQGSGIMPDFVAGTGDKEWETPSAYEPVDPNADAQLQTALSVLQLNGK